MRLKLSSERWIEALLMIPVTATLGLALPFGIVFTVCILVLGVAATGLLGGASALAKELNSAGEVAELLMMMIAATAGLCSLWLNIFLGREWARARAHRKYALTAALTMGLAAAGFWLSLQHPHSSRQWSALWLWIGLLAAPWRSRFVISGSYLDPMRIKRRFPTQSRPQCSSFFSGGAAGSGPTP